MARLAGLAVAALAVAATPAPAVAGRSPVVLAETPATAANLDPVRPIYNSPALATDPTEARFVALAYRADSDPFDCGLVVSGDGGRGWIPAQPIAELPEGADHCYAPEVGFDAEGRLYFLFVGLKEPTNTPMGVYLTTSDDRARTFSPPRQVLGPENYQVRMAIDRSGGGRGRLHLVWLSVGRTAPLGGLPEPPNPIMAAYSDDAGATFSAPVQLSDPARARVVAPALALGPDGAVHVAYYDLGEDARDYQGLEGPTWEGSWSLLVATSTDGGRHFGPSVVVDDAIAPPGRVVLIYVMAPPALVVDGRRLFVAWADARHGDPDAVLARSTDGGRSWSEPLRLNDDPAGTGALQELPRLSVAPNGRLDAIFYDRRNDPANIRFDLYYTSSSDGGGRFGPNLKVTAKSSDSRLGRSFFPIQSAKGRVERGSRLALVSGSSSVLAAWGDMRNNFSHDVLTTKIVLPRPRPRALSAWLAPVAVATAAAAAIAGLFWGRARRRRGAPGPGPEAAT